jgi:hypothetical protein
MVIQTFLLHIHLVERMQSLGVAFALQRNIAPTCRCVHPCALRDCSVFRKPGTVEGSVHHDGRPRLAAAVSRLSSKSPGVPPDICLCLMPRATSLGAHLCQLHDVPISVVNITVPSTDSPRSRRTLLRERARAAAFRLLNANQST